MHDWMPCDKTGCCMGERCVLEPEDFDWLLNRECHGASLPAEKFSMIEKRRAILSAHFRDHMFSILCTIDFVCH